MVININYYHIKNSPGVKFRAILILRQQKSSNIVFTFLFLKKIIAISLLLIVSFSQLGYYVIYRIQQHLIEEEIEAIIFASTPETSFEVFDLAQNSNNIRWKKEGKEFMLHGEMYDVAKIKKVQGKTLLYCLNDKKEKQLLRHFEKAMKHDSGSSKPGKNSIKFQISDFTNIDTEKTTVSFVNIEKIIPFSITILHCQFKEITAPPPKSLSCLFFYRFP
jgi:hypothetical protein